MRGNILLSLGLIFFLSYSFRLGLKISACGMAKVYVVYWNDKYTIVLAWDWYERTRHNGNGAMRRMYLDIQKYSLYHDDYLMIYLV